MAPTNRQKFFKKHGLPESATPSMEELARLSGFPKRALTEVYQKGLGAYYSNPTSVRLKGTFEKNVDAPMSQKLSPQQWASARVYAFLMKTKPVFYGADRHIAEEYRLLP